MSDEEKVNNESRENEFVTPEKESTLREVIETQSEEAGEKMAEIEKTGDSNIAAVEKGGTDQQVEGMKDAIDKTEEGAESTEKKYEEDLKNIPVNSSPNLSFEEVEQKIIDKKRSEGEDVPETDQEFFQNIKVEYHGKINKIIESDRSFPEKKDDLNKLKGDLESEVNMIDDSIIEEGAQKVLDGLGNKINNATISVENLERKSKFTKENLIADINKTKSGLEVLMNSEETNSGKETGIKGIISSFDMAVKVYKDVIDSNKELSQVIDSTRKVLNDKLSELQKK